MRPQSELAGLRTSPGHPPRSLHGHHAGRLAGALARAGRRELAPLIQALKNKPDPVVVSNLEELLAQAKAGELLGFVLVGETAGSATVHTTPGTFNRTKVTGAIEIIKARVVWEMLNESEET